MFRIEVALSATSVVPSMLGPFMEYIAMLRTLCMQSADLMELVAMRGNADQQENDRA